MSLSQKSLLFLFFFFLFEKYRSVTQTKLLICVFMFFFCAIYVQAETMGARFFIFRRTVKEKLLTTVCFPSCGCVWVTVRRDGPTNMHAAHFTIIGHYGLLLHNLRGTASADLLPHVARRTVLAASCLLRGACLLPHICEEARAYCLMLREVPPYCPMSVKKPLLITSCLLGGIYILHHAIRFLPSRLMSA